MCLVILFMVPSQYIYSLELSREDNFMIYSYCNHLVADPSLYYNQFMHIQGDLFCIIPLALFLPRWVTTSADYSLKFV